MGGVVNSFARGSSPIQAAIAGVAGGAIGGGVFLSVSGIVLGLLTALGLAGAFVMVANLLARLTGSSDVRGKEKAVVLPFTSKTAATAPAATTPAPPSDPTLAAVAVSTVPAEAGIAAETLDVTQSEAQLLAAGRFDHYHLAKAKRLFEAKNYKEAAYQALASLCHNTLPEAAELRKAALKALSG